MHPFWDLPWRRCVGVLVITITLLFFFFCLIRPASMDPSHVAQQAQQKLAQTSSYRFELSVRTIIDGQDRIVSVISGEFVQPSTYYLKGVSYDYNIEIYHVDNQLVFLDPVDKRWKKASATPSLVTEAVLFSTSPIADFLSANKFQLVTLERDRGRHLYRLSAQLDDISNPYWKIFFTDFSLESWIEYPSCQVEKLRLYGGNDSSKGNNLIAELILSNHGQPLHITLPKEISD